MAKKRKKKLRIMRPTFKVFRLGKSRWTWLMEARNGKVYAIAGHDYKTKIGCKRAVEAVQNLASACEIDVSD